MFKAFETEPPVSIFVEKKKKEMNTDVTVSMSYALIWKDTDHLPKTWIGAKLSWPNYFVPKKCSLIFHLELLKHTF